MLSLINFFSQFSREFFCKYISYCHATPRHATTHWKNGESAIINFVEGGGIPETRNKR